VGIAAAVFGHETESALAQAKLSTGLAHDAIDREVPKIPLSKKELVKARQAVERVQVWGQFALSRVKKDKRRRTKVDVSKLISNLIDEMTPLFEASTIALTRRVQPDISLRGFAMDFEALLVNLLTNAYHAANLAKRSRQVLVVLGIGGSGNSRSMRLSVSDSGPGITKEHLSQIWAPLFSTRVDDRGRPTGTGLGLTIVKSIADDMQGTVMAAPRGSLGGATVEVSIPCGGSQS
jgi:signal transduction histidine kinase